ncbi:hypothetical protein [Butyrivibrio sp. MC2013]|uniref:hypothetical protein n=1 Tax=Butyrivibrio sp. MC2013 TaxID=1280686 RepID=UPI00041DB8CC|nr:hypothetical protein [Butyrivibrio sp. MC2013]
MKAKAIKLYEEEGTKYHFDSEKLKLLINQKKLSLSKTNKKTTKEEIIENVSEAMCVSKEAIKNWMYGYNGPSDLEQVKKIGDLFETDYHFLLSKEEETMSNIPSGFDGSAQALYTRERVRELHSAFIGFIEKGASHQMELVKVECAFDDGAASRDDVSRCLNSVYRELYDKLDEILNMLNAFMLDIPEAFYDKVFNYVCELQENLSSWYSFSIFPPNEEGEELEYEISGNMQRADDFFFVKGIKDLRQLFDAFIVK